MKKFLSVTLALVIVLSALCLFGCGADKNLKLGLGSYSYYEKITSAEDKTNGKGQAVITVAAVLLDKDGKIVDCKLDCADNTVAYTSEGKAVAASEFKTKYESGENYGMKTYSGIGKEWFEQADAFAAATIGKTMDEVKALVLENGKGSEQISASCTIEVSEFAKAIENAVANAKDSAATKKDTLKLGIVTTQTNKDAIDDANGQCLLEINIAASSVATDGKINATMSDCVEAKFVFDDDGEAQTKITQTIVSKRTQGADYNMKTYGQDLNNDGVILEWFEQADAYDAQCAGKTASELSGLENTKGYGNDAVQSAGCTIAISAMLKATLKSATVA